jgi:hypothetical protein
MQPARLTRWAKAIFRARRKFFMVDAQGNLQSSLSFGFAPAAGQGLYQMHLATPRPDAQAASNATPALLASPATANPPGTG